MSWPGTTVLVTGATGFVGSHLTRKLLAAGARVHCLVRPTSARDRLPAAATAEAHDGSTADAQAILARVRPQVVFHLATHFVAQHQTRDVEPLVGSNLLFTAQLLEAVACAGVAHLVNAGTAWQHRTEAPSAPVTLYAATKQAAEALINYYADAAPLGVVTLKLYDTYGPDDPRQKLFTLLARASAGGKPLPMSPGEQLLELVHVDDACDAFLAAGERLLGGEGSGHERFTVPAQRRYTLREVVDLYGAVTGRKVPVVWGGRPYRAREVMVPWEGTPLPAWRARIALPDGIRTLHAS